MSGRKRLVRKYSTPVQVEGRFVTFVRPVVFAVWGMMFVMLLLALLLMSAAGASGGGCGALGRPVERLRQWQVLLLLYAW